MFKFIKFKKIRPFSALAAVGVSMLLPVVAVCATVIWNEGHKIDSGASQEVIINVVGDCIKINNNSGEDYFVPTKTLEEWDSFEDNLPPGVILSDCVAVVCTSHDHISCSDDDVYWYDSCGNREEKADECGSDSCSYGGWYCSNDDTRKKDGTCYDRGCAGSACYANASAVSNTQSCPGTFYEHPTLDLSAWVDGKCVSGQCLCPYILGDSVFGPPCGGDRECSLTNFHEPCGFLHGTCCDGPGDNTMCCTGFFFTGDCRDLICNPNSEFCWPYRKTKCNYGGYWEDDYVKNDDGHIYWYDSCGVRSDEIYLECDYGCGVMGDDYCNPFSPFPPTLMVSLSTISVGETVNIWWTAVPGATKYYANIFDPATGWSGWVAIGAATSYSGVQLNSAGTWYFQVRGGDGGLMGSVSNERAVSVVCVPSCAGKVCGSDGCGGSCGTCAGGTYCNASGQCCFTNASCGYFGVNCGTYNNGCGSTVNCGTCYGGTSCNASGQCVCVPNCSGKVCGTDGCGGSCGACAGGTYCVGGKCCFKQASCAYFGVTCGTYNSGCGYWVTCGPPC